MTTHNSAKRYLERFFEEKEIAYKMWEIEEEGEMHFIDTDFIKEAITEAPMQEQRQIADQLRKIDFYNGDVLHFFEYLANAFVKVQMAQV